MANPGSYYVAVLCLLDIVVLITALPVDARKGLSLCDLMIDAQTNRRTLKCNVQRGQLFDYRDLRSWSANEKGGKYSVEIHCNGGMVHLPWPFKAENVLSLSVQNCFVEGFLSEMTRKVPIADELRQLELSQVSIDITIAEMLELRNNIDKVPTDTDCGQLTLESFVMRDVHYEIKSTPEERDAVGNANTNTHVHHAVTHRPTSKICVYPNLKYVDESGSRKGGQYHLKLLPEYSIFPKLEIYNMSRNELTHVPGFFRNLQSNKFPALKFLDFSNNFLRSFEFDIPRETVPFSLRIIDLHGNDIAAISPETTQKLENLGTLIVDLRQNPLRCSCRLANLRQYVVSQYRKASDIRHRQLLADTTCMIRPVSAGKLTRVSLLDTDFDLKCQK